MLAIDTIPLFWMGRKRDKRKGELIALSPCRLFAASLLRFFMIIMLAARIAEFFEFQTTRSFLFILGRHVVLILAFLTHKRDVISWHF